jgi:hypothetical protein
MRILNIIIVEQNSIIVSLGLINIIDATVIEAKQSRKRKGRNSNNTQDPDPAVFLLYFSIFSPFPLIGRNNPLDFIASFRILASNKYLSAIRLRILELSQLQSAPLVGQIEVDENQHQSAP